MNVCFSEAQLRMLLSACLDVNGKPGVERRLTLIRMLALACHRWHCSLHQLPSELWEQLFRRRFGDLLWFDDDLVNRLKGEPRQVGTRLIQPRDDMYGGKKVWAWKNVDDEFADLFRFKRIPAEELESRRQAHEAAFRVGLPYPRAWRQMLQNRVSILRFDPNPANAGVAPPFVPTLSLQDLIFTVEIRAGPYLLSTRTLQSKLTSTSSQSSLTDAGD